MKKEAEEKLGIFKVNQRRIELLARLFILGSAMGVSFTHDDVGVVGVWLLDYVKANKKVFGDINETE